MMIITKPSYLYDWQSYKMTEDRNIKNGGYTIILHWIIFIIKLN